MLTVGELRDLRNNKGSRDLTAVSLEIPVSGVKYNVSNLVFSLFMSDSLAKVRDTARSLLHCSPCSHFLLRQQQPEGLSQHCLMQPSGSQYPHNSCSLSPLALQHHTKTNNALLPEWSFKLVHAPSLSSTSRTTALWTNLSPLH